MIEVFKTNVSSIQQADELIGLLQILLPGSIVNFDLEDCDRVLRIEYQVAAHKQVIGILTQKGYECSVMQ